MTISTTKMRTRHERRPARTTKLAGLTCLMLVVGSKMIYRVCKHACKHAALASVNPKNLLACWRGVLTDQRPPTG